jgi:hypothetical protein
VAIVVLHALHVKNQAALSNFPINRFSKK